MVASHPNRRFLIGIVPVLIVFIVIIMQALSVMADNGQTTSKSVGENDLGPLGLMTQDLTTSLTPTNLANKLVGPGITVTNVTYTGALTATGIFSGGTGIIGFEDGIILSSGNMNDVVGPNQFVATTTEQFTPGDPDLDILASSPTFDAAVLEFDFVPDDDQVFFQFVFASEEYNEYVLLGFNDVFGFYINGVNCALVSSLPISVDSINLITNQDLYRNNDLAIGSPINTEADGLTVALTCNAAVNAGTTNHLKIAIADASDLAWDSWIFLKGTSLTTDISINLGPNPGSACQGTPHTLVAIIADTPRENIPVSFDIISGPNMGPLGTALTNADGIATLTYTSTGTIPAIDIAQASFVGSDGQIYFSEQVPINWEVCNVTPTPPPPDIGCTQGIFYWRTHPEDWPVDAITIGNVIYPKTEAIQILEVPPQGDATYVLAHQLIAAKLNILNGADDTAVAAIIVEADAWLISHPLGSNPIGAERREGAALNSILNDYNDGEVGPRRCEHDDGEDEGETFILDG